MQASRIATASSSSMERSGWTCNAYSAQVGHGNAILVNKNQAGNPLLKHLRNINHRFADIVPDYQFNDKVWKHIE
jgi:hypothetical protein